MARTKRQGARGNNVERDMVRSIDRLRLYEKFEEEIAPKLRKMLAEGKSSKEMREWAQAYITARQITIAITSENEAAALKAADAITHQNEGKPVERSETTHRLEKLKDEELDSVILSQLQDDSSLLSAAAAKKPGQH